MASYSLITVVATLLGPTGSINVGYGAQIADEAIEFNAAEDKSHMTIGGDGSGFHSLHADKSGEVIIRLLKTSPTNALLQAAYDAQTISPLLHGQNIINCKQTASGDVTVANQCAFKRKPSIKYHKDGDIMEWLFDAITIDTVLGTY